MQLAESANLRAIALLKRVAELGKPMRAFLGFRCSGAGEYTLIAVDETRKLIKTLPRDELLVTPDMEVTTLAASIVERWASLAEQRKAVRAVMKPVNSHGWRAPNGLSRRRAR